MSKFTKDQAKDQFNNLWKIALERNLQLAYCPEKSKDEIKKLKRESWKRHINALYNESIITANQKKTWKYPFS